MMKIQTNILKKKYSKKTNLMEFHKLDKILQIKIILIVYKIIN